MPIFEMKLKDTEPLEGYITIVALNMLDALTEVGNVMDIDKVESITSQSQDLLVTDMFVHTFIQEANNINGGADDVGEQKTD